MIFWVSHFSFWTSFLICKTNFRTKISFRSHLVSLTSSPSPLYQGTEKRELLPALWHRMSRFRGDCCKTEVSCRSALQPCTVLRAILWLALGPAEVIPLLNSAQWQTGLLGPGSLTCRCWQTQFGATGVDPLLKLSLTVRLDPYQDLSAPPPPLAPPLTILLLFLLRQLHRPGESSGLEGMRGEGGKVFWERGKWNIWSQP